MRTTAVMGAAVLLLAAVVQAGELSSGVPVDGRIGKYRSIKCGGGDDGVALDKALCYT
jgi:hypothetical protein